jgi:V8-like Glu-specific endopeptidase
MMRLRIAVLLALTSAACADAASPTAVKSENPLIYGADDRRDVYEVDDPELRTIATEATVALITSLRLTVDDDGFIQFEAQSLQEAQKVCPEQRFAEQPVLPFCSGVLIDDDLILTAGHCLKSGQRKPEEACREVSFVFGFHYRAPGTLSEIVASDVFGCRELVAFSAPGSNGEGSDYALVRLDRAPRERTPARLAAASTLTGGAADAAAEGVIGDRVHLIGNGAGLPTKVDSGGKVAGIHAGTYLVADTDSFGGGSGSGVFDASMSLLAVQVRGLYDWEAGADCTRAAIGSEPSEQHLLVRHVVDTLCEGGYPSERLCQRQATGEPSSSAPRTDGSCSVAPGRGDSDPFWQPIAAVFIGVCWRRRRDGKPIVR